MEELFNSRYGRVEYMNEDNVVLLSWKEKCSYDDYRNVTLAALSGLQNYPQSNFIVDARNGFEDEIDDIEWGFSTLLPAMSKTTCKIIVFILSTVNNIEEEMDLWTKEFMKYFRVVKVDSYAKAVIALAPISR